MGRQREDSLRGTGEKERSCRKATVPGRAPSTAAVSPQHTGHGPPNPLLSQSYPLLWVSASASPQRREMHTGKERQDNRELSKPEEG